MPDRMPSVAQGVLGQPFAEQAAFFRNKLGNLVPTSRWDDIERGAHDTAFMVAGAAKADLLADLAAAVDRAVTEGKSLQAFRQDFRAIVERQGWHGWTGESTAGGRAWRTRVIYRTNAITSYAAGRLAQLREGEFRFWIYRHNDSVRYPRPLHVSWNGLTLPPDDPFWRAHYPPNGWGCQCYVLGARSEAMVRRMGGNSDKARPEDWDATDAKTGAPLGIDTGWDYQPGDRVSRTVATMAEKAREWPYDLAKSYMQNVPAGVRDSLANSYRSLPSVADDTRRYAQRVVRGDDPAQLAPRRTLGLLTDADARQAETVAGVDVGGFDYAIAPGAIPANAEAGPYALLPALLNQGAALEAAGLSATGRQLVRRRWESEGITWVAVFEILPESQTLLLQTLYAEGGN